MQGVINTIVNLFGWHTILLWVLQHLLGTVRGATAFAEIAPVIEKYVSGGASGAASAG